jgi:allantoin racemase
MSVLDLMRDRERLTRRYSEVGLRCVLEDGAHALIPGCGAMEAVTWRVRELLLQEGVDVPLLEPYPIALRQVEALVSMGLRHSKISYPAPKSTDVSC